MEDLKEARKETWVWDGTLEIVLVSHGVVGKTS